MTPIYFATTVDIFTYDEIPFGTMENLIWAPDRDFTNCYKLTIFSIHTNNHRFWDYQNKRTAFNILKEWCRDHGFLLMPRRVAKRKFELFRYLR